MKSFRKIFLAAVVLMTSTIALGQQRWAGFQVFQSDDGDGDHYIVRELMNIERLPRVFVGAENHMVQIPMQIHYKDFKYEESSDFNPMTIYFADATIKVGIAISPTAFIKNAETIVTLGFQPKDDTGMPTIIKFKEIKKPTDELLTKLGLYHVETGPTEEVPGIPKAENWPTAFRYLIDPSLRLKDALNQFYIARNGSLWVVKFGQERELIHPSVRKELESCRWVLK